MMGKIFRATWVIGLVVAVLAAYGAGIWLVVLAFRERTPGGYVGGIFLIGAMIFIAGAVAEDWYDKRARNR